MQMTMQSKDFFFDRAVVQSLLSNQVRRAMEKTGGEVGKTAARSMRYVTTLKEQERRIQAGERKLPAKDPAVSKPGEPPRAIQPHPWIRKNMLYAFDPSTQSVVVGPANFNPASGAPHTLEFGGRGTIRNKRRTRYRGGWGGPIRIGPPFSVTTKATETINGVAMVTYATLKTAAMVARANALNEFMYGAAYKVVNVAARPYMQPALMKMIPRMPDFLRPAAAM